MIKLIYGPKGFGKTKIMLDDVNAAAEKAKGNVVFITDKRMCSVAINLNVRCVYTEEYGINTVDGFEGFVKGLIAGNHDIENIFIDGILRITDANLDQLEKPFNEIKKICDENDVALEVTVSATKEQLPKFATAAFLENPIELFHQII